MYTVSCKASYALVRPNLIRKGFNNNNKKCKKVNKQLIFVCGGVGK